VILSGELSHYPSMTALMFGSESEIDSANTEKEVNGCPLRESN